MSRRALALVCYLLLKRRAATARGAVTLAIWPDDDEATARAALRRELHRAIKALPETNGEPWIVADQTELRWNERAGAWLDIDAFETSLASQGRAHEAVDLYRGELLDGLEDEWVFAERERFRAANMSALGKLLASSRSVHDYEAAIGYAGRILTEDPFREDVVRTLISLRFESGDRAGALHEAERYAKLYREELGVGLMPETEALRFAISRGEPAATTSTVSAPSAGERQRRLRGFTPPFAGRAKEFETALGLWHRAMRGVGGVLFVAGEAGIGKSRLVQELALVAERQGGRVLTGHTSAPERLPYEAIAAALGNAIPLLGSVRAEPDVRRSLERIIPGLAAAAPAKPAPGIAADVEREQTRLFASLTHYVSALARTRPLLLVLEDIHWARPSTLAALQALAEAASNARVLVVTTLRTESIGHALADTRRTLVERELGAVLPLARLTPEDTREIARSTARAEHFDEATIEELVSFSEGNPFYLIEGIVGFAAAGGALPAEGGAIADMITARVERMSESVVDVASVAANIGERFTLDALRAVCGLDEATLLDGVGQLIEEHFLVETTGRSSFDYSFTHHLIRNAIYERIPIERRKRRHRLIARYLEQHTVRSSGSAIDVARHYVSSGATADAAEWYCRAADFAVRSYANDEAATLLERALEYATEPAVRFEALSARHALRVRLGDEREAQDLATMSELAASLDDGARFRAHYCALQRALRVGNVAEAEAQIATLAAHRHLADRHRVGLAIARTRLDIMSDKRDDATAAARAGLELVDETTPSSEVAELLCYLSSVLFHHGDVDEGTAVLARAMSLSSLEDGNAALIARTNLAAARKAYALAIFEECDRFATASMDAARIVGDREAIVDALGQRSAARRAMRRLADARADMDAALELGATLAYGPMLARITLLSCMIDADSGELERAQHLCDEVIVAGREIVGQALLADAYLAKTFCRALSGDYVTARGFAQTANELFGLVGNRIHEAYALNNLGALERELGNVSAGLDQIERALEIMSPIFSTNDLASSRAERALARAEIGDIEAAREEATALLEMPVDGAGLSWQHLTFYTIWRVLELTGNRESASTALSRACEAFALHYEMVPEQCRERFLAIPIHREMLENAQRRGIVAKIRLPAKAGSC